MSNRICSVAPCDRPARSRGWCSVHYTRWRKTGDVQADVPILANGKAHRPLAVRFWEKVDASGDCWEWTGFRTSLGYGQFRITDSDGRWTTAQAHRQAWELLVGPIPEGYELDHLCRNTPCVNPDHLEPVTPEENRRRSFNELALSAFT